MPYEEALVARVRSALLRAGASDPREIRMFGGLCFTAAGHMCCGVTGSDLMVRVGPNQHAAALARAHARPMDFTGRPLRGFVFVGPKGTTRSSQVEGWIALALSFTATLPPKRSRPTKSPRGPRPRRGRLSRRSRSASG
jgi:hypothetical protein